MIMQANVVGRIGCGLAVGIGMLAGYGAAQAQTPAPPRVVVTIKPLHALVAQVMGDTGTPHLIVDGSASPHSYALKPSDARKLQAANVVFRVSEAFETFSAKALKALPKGVEVVTLEDTQGLKLLKRRTDPNFAGDEGAAGKDHSKHGHAKAAAGEQRDPHVWLDPDNARVMIDQIAAVLTRKDATRAESYKANAAKARASVDALTRELERDLAPVAGRPYVVFHDAYQYFEARFGLTPVGSVTINPEVPPSGKRLVDLRKKVTGLGAQCVFAEPSFEMKVVQSIVEGTPVRTAILDPEAALLSPGPELYSEMMRRLATALKGCLSPST
jgi:zinc transport system substrate-binding protein